MKPLSMAAMAAIMDASDSDMVNRVDAQALAHFSTHRDSDDYDNAGILGADDSTRELNFERFNYGS